MRPLIGACCLFLIGLTFTSPAVPVGAQNVVLRSGTLDVLWKEAEGGQGCTPFYSLVEDNGERASLEPRAAAAGEWPALVGKRVTVTALPAAPGQRQAETDSLQVQHLAKDEYAELNDAGVARGAKKYLTILCRFADRTDRTPKSRQYFQQMFSDRRYGIIAHFRKASYGALSLDGSQVVGWVNLPRTLHAYGSGAQFDSDLVLYDAIEAASRQASASDFDGINLAFNLPAFGPSIGGWGGRRTLNLDGVTKSYGVTWLAYADQALFVHEMGHTLGLPHSSGPYSKVYDSRWDVMSQPYQGKRTKFGYVAQDTIAYHKHLLGWIDGASTVTVAPGRKMRLTLRSLCNSEPANYLVKIPVDSSGKRMYTLEVRKRHSLDREIPGAGAVLHYVDTARRDRVATVVDVDNNGNPNDAASRWLPGEEFRDAPNAIRIAIVAAGGPSLTIDVFNRAGY